MSKKVQNPKAAESAPAKRNKTTYFIKVLVCFLSFGFIFSNALND